MNTEYKSKRKHNLSISKCISKTPKCKNAQNYILLITFILL